MAMVTPIYASASISTSKTTQTKLSRPTLDLSSSYSPDPIKSPSFSTAKFPVPNSKPHQSSSISAVSTPIIETDQPTSSTTRSKSLPFRVGHGFDLHRLEPGYPLIIGGITIPHDRGCEAHSDGDVLLHCVVDAILGALGLPDIGQIFPDTDPEWKGAPSSVFIKEAVSVFIPIKLSSFCQVILFVKILSPDFH
ncbi:hypothetical protein Dimus_037448 [Dionaea muscipula]